jgi:hypothetical protein
MLHIPLPKYPFNIIVPSTFGSFKWSPSLMFSTKSLSASLRPPIRNIITWNIWQCR